MGAFGLPDKRSINIKRSRSAYIFTLCFIIIFNFLIPRLMPGDPFTNLSGEEGDVISTFSDEQIEKYKAYYGLDKSLGKQFVDYIKNLLKGNLGYSINYKESVWDIIKSRAKWTMPIVIISSLLACFFGVLLGSISAWNRDSKPDKVFYFIMLIISEIPSFLIGILFLFILAGSLKLFPLAGGKSTFANYANFFEAFKDYGHHAFLPILTLTISGMGPYYLLARSSMVTVLDKAYIKTAKSKGLKDRRVIFSHALKNSILPIITRLFISLGVIFSGAILVENVFTYPGIGSLMNQAIRLRDYPLIQGIFLFVAILVLLMNFLADRTYELLDPRVRK